MNLHRASVQAGLSSSISRAFGPISCQPFGSLLFSSERSLSPLAQNPQATFSGCPESYKSNVSCGGNIGSLILGNLSQKLVSLKVKQMPSLPCALTFRCSIHSGDAKKADTGSIYGPDTGSISRPDAGRISGPDTGRISRSKDFAKGISGQSGIGRFGGSPLTPYTVEQNADAGNISRPDTGNTSRSMDFVRGILGENGIGGFGGSPLSPHTVEQNADIVHIKLLRNNTFVTLTDSKGNKKKPGERLSASAGSLPDKGGKVSRYGAEATAEHVGREASKAGVKSVVVKVNGFTFFKKKRQAIMAFREGYTHGRGGQTPIVYIEDTTRRPHNGCRLPKKRRI